MGYTHGVEWNEDLIESEIRKVMDMLNINRMPSTSEIKSVLNDESLTNKISRSGGFFYWARKLRLENKESETKLGQAYEVIAIDLLKAKGYEVDRMTTLYPFDLLVNNNIKIDIKVGKPGDIKGCRTHTFRTAKKYATCDLYMIFALEENDLIEKLFIIPGHELKVVTMCIGGKSKYDKFIDRWDLIDKYNKFYQEISV